MPDESADQSKHDRVEPVSLTAEEARRGQYVPYDRFTELRADLKSAMTELGSMTSRYNEADAARKTAETAWTTAKADLERQLEDARSQASWSESAVALARDGYTDDRTTRYIRRDFEDRPPGEDGKKPDWQAWWAANAGEYETVFGALRGGAKPPETPPAAATKPPAAGKKDTAPPPKTREDRNATKPNAGQFSEEAILNMSAEDWKANKDTIIKGVLSPGAVEA